MSRKVRAKTFNRLELTDEKVETIFQAEAKHSGNGAILYVPLKYLTNKNRFYVVVCK